LEEKHVFITAAIGVVSGKFVKLKVKNSERHPELDSGPVGLEEK